MTNAPEPILLAAAGWINTFILSWLMILEIVPWWPNVLFLFLFFAIAFVPTVNLAYPSSGRKEDK